MKGRRAALFLVLGLLAGCASLPPVDGARARASYELARQRAFAPRRCKALFKGEASQNAGGVVRGYLSLWWDGRIMRWKTSAPLAGAAQSGVLRSDGDTADSARPLPLPPRDAIGALLGALDLEPGDVTAARGGALVALPGRRYALVDGDGRVMELRFEGDQVIVRFTPGDGLPRRIEATSREGRVVLTLDSYLPWPEDEVS